MTFSIIIASHGDERWRRLAQTRALPSATAQGTEVLIEHDPTGNRAAVRNMLAEQATGKWLIFLDADDELAPGYVDAMRNHDHYAVRDISKFAGYLLTPAVQYVYGRRRRPPTFWPECDLTGGNWMVVGTAVPANLFWEVGGWKHLHTTPMPNEYDDWHLWSRCVKAGAVPVKVPDAVYVAHVQKGSKHRAASREQKLAWHKEVYDEVWA